MPSVDGGVPEELEAVLRGEPLPEGSAAAAAAWTPRRRPPAPARAVSGRVWPLAVHESTALRGIAVARAHSDGGFATVSSGAVSSRGVGLPQQAAAGPEAVEPPPSVMRALLKGRSQVW